MESILKALREHAHPKFYIQGNYLSHENKYEKTFSDKQTKTEEIYGEQILPIRSVKFIRKKGK